MSETLLPCPFCGSCDVGLDRNDETNFDVTCWKCQAGTAVTYGPEARTKEAAFTAWNTRAAMQADAAPVAWMPIDTAPTDWKEIIVYSPDHESSNTGGICSAFCDPDNGWFTHTHGGNMKLNPTHWMPLPAAPVDDRVSTPKPVDDRGSGNTSGKSDTAPDVKSDTAPVSDKLRPAVEVWEDAYGSYMLNEVGQDYEAAAAIIEADRAALVAEIVADLRNETRTYQGSEYSGFVAMITEDIAAKWGGK